MFRDPRPTPVPDRILVVADWGARYGSALEGGGQGGRRVPGSSRLPEAVPTRPGPEGGPGCAFGVTGGAEEWVWREWGAERVRGKGGGGSG